jgi:hypothetical protein
MMSLLADHIDHWFLTQEEGTYVHFRQKNDPDCWRRSLSPELVPESP